MDRGFLAIVDADRIHEYIFAPHRLKMVRGGSALLRSLNHEHLLRELLEGGYGPGNLSQDLTPNDATTTDAGTFNWELVYAGGGNVYVLFRDRAAAEKYVSRAQWLFRKQSGTATATCIVTPHEGVFRATFEVGLALLNQRKTSAADPHSPLTSPYWKSCEACGREPAAWLIDEPDDAQVLLCTACETRKKHSRQSPYLEKINGKLVPVQDLETLSAGSRPDGYLALVYVDVDSLGKYFDQLEPFTVETYRETSHKIRKTVESAVIESCRHLPESLSDGTAAPFEILLVGGDDALIILRPQHVCRFLRCFRVSFRKHWREPKQRSGSSGRDLTFSAGIVFAHHHLPIAQFLQHAEELLRSAKDAGGGRADYMVVTEAMTSGLKARDARRTMRPYPLRDLLQLWRTIGRWKMLGFPARRAHQLYQAAYEEEHQGTLDYLYLLARLEERHRRLAQQMFAQGLWERTPRRATRAADIAEIWDFVEET
ncbi:MAG TPA: hypothetical protein VKY85_07275 [Candidatus Angelobacter sp.]|nr:hypothetical protein [Candidatus Angelobacter sp.]